MAGLAETPPARAQGADDGHRPEEVVGQAVDGPFQFLLDAVHDHGRVRRDGAPVVGDEERSTLGRDLLEAVPLDTEPFRIDGLVQRAGQRASAFGSAPLVDIGHTGVLGVLEAVGGDADRDDDRPVPLTDDLAPAGHPAIVLSGGPAETGHRATDARPR